jgi:hypothetical protein
MNRNVEPRRAPPQMVFRRGAGQQRDFYFSHGGH